MGKPKAVFYVFLALQAAAVCAWFGSAWLGTLFQSSTSPYAIHQPKLTPRKPRIVEETASDRRESIKVEPTHSTRHESPRIVKETEVKRRADTEPPPRKSDASSSVRQEESLMARLRRLGPSLMTSDIGPESDSNCVISNVKAPADLGRNDIIWNCSFSPTFVYHDRVKRTIDVACKGKFTVNFVNGEESDEPRSDNGLYEPDPKWEEYTGPKVLPFDGQTADVLCNGHHNYRTQIKVDEEMEQKQRRVYEETVKKDGSQPLSVLLISVDSMSRANFYRPYAMPRTAALIKRLFYAVEDGGNAQNALPSHRTFLFNRLNSINRFTAMNLVPFYSGEMLSGQEERDRVHYHAMKKKVHEWEWEYANSRGYLTSYGVDTRNGLFGTRTICKACKYRPGVVPFWVDKWDRKINTKRGNVWSGWCAADGLLFEYIKNYTLQVLQRDYPAIWASFDTAAHHSGEAESGNQIDASLTVFLETAMKENPNLTVILFGDHGKLYGKYPGHIGGRYESLMPFFSITLPQHVLKRRPDFAKNLLENSQRLISYFDVHKTVKSLMHYPYVEKVGGYFAPHAVNILTNTLSPTRSCKEAGVPEWLCVCNSATSLPKEKWTPEFYKAVDKAIDFINGLHKTEEIKNSNTPTSCLDVKFKQISSVSVSQNRQTKNSASYAMVVNFDVVEGPGTFKLIASRNLEIQSLKQLTRYAKYTDCLDKRVSIEYCICKNFPAGTP